MLAAKVAYERDILAAWRTKDREGIRRIASVDLPELIDLMKDFAERYRQDWHTTSQPFGFERMQARNAVALVRLEEAKRRLDDYCAGRVETMEELDEAMKPFGLYSPKPPIAW